MRCYTALAAGIAARTALTHLHLAGSRNGFWHKHTAVETKSTEVQHLAEQLSTMLQRCTGLHGLALEWLRLPEDVLARIAPALPGLTKLSILSLEGNSCGAHSAALLLGALANMPRLQQLAAGPGDAQSL